MNNPRILRKWFVAFLLIGVGLAACQESYRDRWQQPETIMDTVGVKPGMVIGEAGAGEGYFTFKLARRVGPTGKIYANDILKKALDEINKHCRHEGIKNVETILGKIDNPMFPIGQLDMVIMVYVFHELDKPVEFFQNIKPSLKPHASVVIIDRDPERYGWDKSHFMKKADVLEYIKQAGYEILHVYTFLTRDNIYVCRPGESVQQEDVLN